MAHLSEHRNPRRRAAGRRLIMLLTATVAVVTAFLILKVWGVVGQPSATATIRAFSGSAPKTVNASGYIPDGESISLWSGDPAVGNLDSDLLEAMRRAAGDARRDGIELRVTGGWRSAAHQRELFEKAVVAHGGVEAASRFVKTPEDSTHVRGTAIDIGPTDADYWLIEHGSAYGLCQIYANEIWHFELATEPGGLCPEMTLDASGS
ncbi:MAG TPA: M15 family metallopeptidase [Solirubrobacterales bacterium]|nr:M15 family metallopeptidase [Solirubrobacterales bacterium]